jgi:hypothetical protein
MGEDLATLICLECSTRTTGVTIPADERAQHNAWHHEMHLADLAANVPVRREEI